MRPIRHHRHRVTSKLRATGRRECLCTAASTGAVPGLQDAADRPDSTWHALACGNIKAQPRLHTAMNVAARTLLTELVPSLVVTGSKDAYPSNHGFAVSAAHPEAVNHRADACVYDTTTGSASLDFAYMCAVTDT